MIKKLDRTLGVFYIFFLLFFVWLPNAYSGFEIEPNNDMNHATAITNGLYEGLISASSDQDWYKFTLSETCQVNYQFTHASINGYSWKTYWKISILDSNGTQLQSNGVGISDSIDSFIGLAAGTYYVKIEKGSYTPSDGSYDLTINYTSSFSVEIEPNEKSSQATQVKSGVSYKGLISASSDQDWYTFTLSDSFKVDYQFTHASINGYSWKTYWKISILDSNGTQLQANGVGNSDSIDSFIGLAAGTYYVKIEKGSYTSDAIYNLTINTGDSAPQGSTTLWYYDGDGDGYGDPAVSLSMAAQPYGYVATKTDCDDSDATIHPGATEIAGDGIDQDCDGADLTGSTTTLWYYDGDGDGYGDPAISLSTATQPYGYVATKTDCNDSDATIHPGATEIAGDGIDQDCDGTDLTGSTTTLWYYDGDKDGYGDPTISLSMPTQPYGYVATKTDCDDSDATIHPGATEIAGDGIDQDCDGTDLTESTGIALISLLSPVDYQSTSFGAAGGKITFSFSKVSNAAKYILHLNLNDILNDVNIKVPVELIPPAVTSNTTPNFSEQFIGMLYDLTLDAITWDILSLYDIEWGIEAYDNAGVLIGSTYKGSVVEKYTSHIKFIASNSVVMTSPSPGDVLAFTDAAPTFKWETYKGVSHYTLILAHMGSLGFDNVVSKDNLTLNLFPMDNPTWQTMSAGKWYWTILGYDAVGNQTPQDFTIFDFTVQ